MAVYTIIRVYEVPADNRIQATDQLAEAMALGVEEDYHVTDVVREPDAKKPGAGVPEATESWRVLLVERLLGGAVKR